MIPIRQLHSQRRSERKKCAPDRELGPRRTPALYGRLHVVVADLADALVAPAAAHLAVLLQHLTHAEVARAPDDDDRRCCVGRHRQHIVHRMWCIRRTLRIEISAQKKTLVEMKTHLKWL